MSHWGPVLQANYTLDSNAMIVGFLNEFADAEEAVRGSATAVRDTGRPRVC